MDRRAGKLASGRGRLRLAWGAAGAMMLAGCNRGILDPAGPVAAQEKQILINSTAIMLAIIVPTMIATVAFAWWFRRGNSKATYRPDWEYSGAIEMVVWAIPALTILLLGGIAWIGSHDLDPGKPLRSAQPPLEVEVVALDWKWLFLYPEQGVATVNRLVVPAGRPLSFKITSATVWNSFFVPQLGTMIYAMPRMTTRLNLQADKPGSFAGLSSHFSGDGFSGMNFTVEAVPAAQFAGWAQATRGAGPALDAAAYAELAGPSSYVQPMAFGAVAPGLFDAIAGTGQAPPPAPSPIAPRPPNPVARAGK